MGAFRYLLRSPTGHYLGEYVGAVPDWSEGDTFADKEGRRFRIVTIDPGRILGAIHATWTVELVSRWPRPRDKELQASPESRTARSSAPQSGLRSCPADV